MTGAHPDGGAAPDLKAKKRPPSRRSPILSALSGALTLILLVALVGGGAFAWATQRLRAPGPLSGDKVVIIPTHTSVPDVVAGLERQGVIDDSLLFNVALVIEGKRSKVRAGEYLFHKSETMQAVMDMIVSGKQLLHSLTIPEGLTSEQIVDRVAADDVLSGAIEKIPAEGALWPETYKFFRGESRARILRDMERDAAKALQQAWRSRDRDTPLKSPAQLLILASMIEKETGRPDERPMVAAVFLNRLKRGMRLQSDPTVVYGLVGGKGTLGAGITRAELLQPTAYNTYLVNGLPPGPICNPGLASLEAAAHPAHTDDLYFVADGSGGHAFAATLAQHNKNVQRWRELEKAKAQQTPNVDHVLPQDLPSGAPSGASARARRKPNQRSDLGASPVYGALPASLGRGRRSPASGAFAQLARMAPALAGAGQADDPTSRPSRRSAGLLRISLGPQLDALGLSLADAPAGLKPIVQLDGPADDPKPGEFAPSGAPAATRTASNAPAPSLPPIDGHPRIIDASVGTPLDPLKNTTWDLNSAKVVPSLN